MRFILAFVIKRYKFNEVKGMKFLNRRLYTDIKVVKEANNKQPILENKINGLLTAYNLIINFILF
jgi:hypothetical protein